VISQSAEYALRAATFLAESPGRPRRAREISSATQVPPSYLQKILGALTRANIVRSRRGPKGGFELACSPENTSSFDVIVAVEPWKRFDRCPLGNPSHEGQLCELHRRIAEAQAFAEHSFRSSTLRDLVGDRAMHETEHREGNPDSANTNVTRGSS